MLSIACYLVLRIYLICCSVCKTEYEQNFDHVGNRILFPMTRTIVDIFRRREMQIVIPFDHFVPFLFNHSCFLFVCLFVFFGGGSVRKTHFVEPNALTSLCDCTLRCRQSILTVIRTTSGLTIQ